ncbi:MAG: FkbM family methyltransferase [Phycisphaerales bacterium]|nr:FkbM family methyltransferase [Phycisphaerales bacterium]
MFAQVCKATIRAFPNGRVTRRMLAEIGRRLPRSAREHRTKLFNGQPFVVDLAEYLGQDIHVYGCYEREACEYVLSRLRPGDTFLDIGGHIGLYTTLAAKAVGPTGRVHTFEPGTKQRALLTRNIEINGLSNVTLNAVCVGGHRGTATFVEGPSRNLGTSHVVEGVAPGSGPAVDMVSVDDYVREKGITSIRGIKIDVEGAEDKVFAGAERTLAEIRPEFIFFECDAVMSVRYGARPEQTLERLRKAGYDVQALVRGRVTPLADAGPGIVDFIALRP